MHKLIHVAVGAITDGNGNILLAKRPEHAHQGGLWEFPGGKVEPGETLLQALDRELYEELDIRVLSAEPVIEIIHDYGDKTVWLDVHRVTGFRGEPLGKEGQPLKWVPVAELSRYQFPAANYPIVNALTLPDRLLITGDYSGAEDFTHKLTQALRAGISLVQLRAHQSSDQNYLELARRAADLCAKYRARLVLNRHNAIDLLKQVPAHGVHLTSAQLQGSAKIPQGILWSASCHNVSQLQLAVERGAHYTTLSPVKPTLSHPCSPTLGWDDFVQQVKKAAIPVYALGGMTEADLPIAKQKGAQGIAAISAWWGRVV
ncbi:Nudix family hydrolase [Gilvimarinus chinensis]|uniref:Nudix family hydrolase n=1 Tax=Gilvimarinus chinensis TaxID=396005 RepID=UPI00037B5A68|nr:Nudix family hydrolase [Gilvimarinus chinensis]